MLHKINYYIYFSQYDYASASISFNPILPYFPLKSVQKMWKICRLHFAVVKIEISKNCKTNVVFGPGILSQFFHISTEHKKNP